LLFIAEETCASLKGTDAKEVETWEEKNQAKSIFHIKREREKRRKRRERRVSLRFFESWKGLLYLSCLLLLLFT